MPKLRSLSGRETCEILESHGFTGVRQQGSHRIMQLRDPSRGSVSVPVPMHRTIKRGTLVSIIRQSGLPRRLFEAD